MDTSFAFVTDIDIGLSRTNLKFCLSLCRLLHLFTHPRWVEFAVVGPLLSEDWTNLV